MVRSGDWIIGRGSELFQQLCFARLWPRDSHCMVADLTSTLTDGTRPLHFVIHEGMPNHNSFTPSNWPVWRQLKNGDVLGLDVATASSDRTKSLAARTKTADRVVASVCPYCAVGCGQQVYVKNEKIINLEGDPASPVSQGCLCPKGAATFQLVTGSHRVSDVLYRRPYGTKWEKIPLERATDMVAERIKKARDENWEDRDKDGHPLRRTMSLAHLGGATLDNEENYLIKKLFTALGIVQIENQARI